MVNTKFINILGQREITATNFHVVIRTINHKISNAWFWGYVGLDFLNFTCISVILGIYWLRFPKLHVYLSRSWKIFFSDGVLYFMVPEESGLAFFGWKWNHSDGCCCRRQSRGPYTSKIKSIQICFANLSRSSSSLPEWVIQFQLYFFCKIL